MLAVVLFAKKITTLGNENIDRRKHLYVSVYKST